MKLEKPTLSTQSTPVHFNVSPHGDDWDVSVGQQVPIRFDDRATAVTAALAGARKIWENFRERADVHVADEDGWHVVRTFGH